MSGNRASGDGLGYVTALTIGQTSWVAPAPGFYVFTAIGAGYYSTGVGVGGRAGGAAQIRKRLAKGDVVTASVGFGATSTSAGTDTTLTFLDGTVVTVVAATGAAVGAASGGDTNVQGNVASAGTGGAGPTIGDFTGAASFAGGGSTSQAMPIGTGGSYFGGNAYSGGNGAIYIRGV